MKIRLLPSLATLSLCAGAALLLGSEVWPPTPTPAPLVGFSYSPLMLYGNQRDPAQDLRILLDATNPDLVRLPVYWESVQPAPDTLNFSSVDGLLAVVAEQGLRHRGGVGADVQHQPRAVLDGRLAVQ